MADITDPLEQARSAFARHDWSEAREAYLAARDHTDLGPDDVSALAEAAWWLGAIDECFSASEEAYRLYLHGDRPASRQAAMLALDLGFFWFLRGETALGSGWFSRAARLLADQPDCVEQGYLRSLEIDEAIAQGDLEHAVLTGANPAWRNGSRSHRSQWSCCDPARASPSSTVAGRGSGYDLICRRMSAK